MTSKVSISARVVAAGVTADGNVRLSISLMPEKSAAGSIDMARWPLEVHQFLLRGGIEGKLAVVAPKISVIQSRPLAPTGSLVPLEIRYGFVNFDIAGVQKLWTDIGEATIARASPALALDEFWRDVAAAFPDRNATSAPLPAFMDKPAANESRPAVPVVLSTGRGDAAVMHLLDRATQLASRLKPATAVGNRAPATVKKSWEQEGIDIRKKSGSGEQLNAIYTAAIEAENKVVEDAATAYHDANKVFLAKSMPASDDNLPDYTTPVAIPTTLVSHPIKMLFAEDHEEPLAKARNLHLAALLPDIGERPANLPPARKPGADDPPKDAPVEQPASYRATQFIAAIRSSPMLARLFHFVIDVECESPFNPADLITSADPAEETFAFAFLGAGLTDSDGNVPADTLLFSIAKATRHNGKWTGFWPVTREEVDLRCQRVNSDESTLAKIRKTGAVSQVDGVVDLGQARSEPGTKGYNPRFDIVSVDPAFAMETSDRNVKKLASVEDAFTRTARDAATLRAPFQDEPEMGTVSRGLSIVDRWRALSVAREIMTTEAARRANLRILDADDLTIGYRVDVAVRTAGDGEILWRSLMEREIDYRRYPETPGKDDFKEWFKSINLDRPRNRKTAAELSYEADRRRDYDAGMTMPTSRRRLRSKDQMIHAEELIAAWEGDPLGLNCGRETVWVRPGSDLAIDRTFYLPNEDNEETHKAWPLRYGWAYRFGIRPVWLGGVSLSLTDAAFRYKGRTGGQENLTLPRSGWGSSERSPNDSIEIKGWQRFLRYEPILAPVVLLPDVIANEPSPFMPQSGIRAILRTLEVGDPDNDFAQYKDRQTKETWRVILPPQVSLDEAVRHGVFDGLDDRTKIAPGGLLDVDYDESLGDRAKGRFSSDEIVGERKNGFPTVIRTEPKNQDSRPAFEDFFRVRETPKRAEDRDTAGQYYVDPMAEHLIVALRPNNGRPGQGYFDGARQSIRVQSNARDRRVLPVVLGIKRDERPLRTTEPNQEDFWDGTAVERKINGKSMNGRPSGASMQAMVATLRLRAGESIAVDCWFVPSVETLRACFGWPEVLAVKAANGIDNPMAKRTPYREQLIAKLREILEQGFFNEKPLSNEMKKLVKYYKDVTAWVGIAGVTADPAAVAVAAAIFHDHLLRSPIPEIAAVRTIDVVHAVAKPPRQPQFTKGGSFNVLRTPSDDRERLDVLKKYGTTDWQDDDRFGKQGYDGIVFAGKIEMDRDTCRQLEILAHCTSPARGALDDIRLGRTELQRLLGEWPNRVVPFAETGKVGEPARVRLTQSARHLFGFDVDEYGMVYLPKQEVTLLQLDDLAERADNSNFFKSEPIDLTLEQGETLTRRLQEPKDRKLAKGALRAAPLDAYTDRHARKIVVSLRATSRFDPYFLRLAATDQSPLPETQFPPVPEQVGLIQSRSYQQELPPFDDEYSNNVERSAPDVQLRTLWIPATVAPAKPQVHAALPSYDIVRPKREGEPASGPSEKQYWYYCRKPCVRIMLDRPWFSSGEGERLGVVLWPPQLRAIGTANNDAARLQRGEVPRSVLHRFVADEFGLMKLMDFEDEDLGAGGKFTTRWGADPIRQNVGPMGPFLPAGALLDLIGRREPAPTDNSIGYVPSIAIPLRDLREAEQAGADSKPKEPETAYETLTAALATYVPRFDVESEKWFVDLALNSDRVVEPFLRLGLVRYQAEASEHLRASAPVSTWAQVLPVRTVQVWLSTDSTGDTLVEVQVSGNVSGRSKTDAGDGDELAYPRVRVSIIEIADAIGGVAIERTAVARKRSESGKNNVGRNAPAESVQTVPAVAWAESSPPDAKGLRESPLTWRATFSLPVKIDETEGVSKRLAVLVEEVEDYLSTANVDASAQNNSQANAPGLAKQASVALVSEPPAAAPMPTARGVFDLDAIKGDEIEKGMARTGPRFLARIDMSYDVKRSTGEAVYKSRK